MREVLIDHIKDGDVVACDVCSPSRNVLLHKGTVITPALGRRLRNWGIQSVAIEGEENLATSVVAEKVSAVGINEDLYAMFHDTLDNARMKKIFDAVCERKHRRSCSA